MLYYIRNEDGSLIGFKYNNDTYYYLKNLQEDIIGITDSNFNKLCSYEYNAWGEILSIKDNSNQEITDASHIAIINPYRYRSYYYDTETKLYYLNSRYYNPAWGRFINADGIINGNSDIMGYNLYAYVGNKAIIASDDSGEFINIKTIKNHLKRAIQTITTVVSSTIGAIGNVAISASMFNKSMNNPTNKINKITKNKLINKISKSKEMEKAVSDCINTFGDKTSFTCSGSTELKSDRDLTYSVGRANYNINAEYHPLLNTTTLNIIVSDKYDFGEKTKNPKTIKEIANNFGTFYEENGLLKTYNWDIKYTQFVFHK